jgi:hypothetical protein
MEGHHLDYVMPTSLHIPPKSSLTSLIISRYTVQLLIEGSSVDADTGYGLDGLESIPVKGERLFSWTRLGPTWPPIHAVPGTLSQGVKRPGREADHSPPSSTEVKNGGTTLLLPNMS